MTDDELQALVAQNSKDIAGLKQTLNSLITDVIRPMSETTVAMQQRSTENQQRSSENESLFRTLLAEAREDRKKTQKQFEANEARFQAQQEAIRALLLRLAMLNQDFDEDLEA
ncbi:MAG: hypothetical protein AAFY72_16765 [Cyanobacteria bacterium J06649_4]